MSFLRRKSGVYHEDIYFGDPEPQFRRRRLSKAAPASSSSSSSGPLSLPVPPFGGQKTTNKPGHSPASTYFANDSREAVRSHLFTSPSASELDLIKPLSATFPSVYMATTVAHDFNAQDSSSQLSLLSPTLPTYPISRMLSAKRASENHKPSISSLGSKERYVLEADLGNVSPESSTENLTSDPAPPTRRTASFTPGMATRVPTNPQQIIHEESECKIIPVRSVIKRKAVPQRIPTVEIQRHSSPPLPTDRSGSPTNSNVAHIGRLGLGSLHVVNGRASPTPSEKSKKGSSFWGPTVKRETSSCYPESEIGTIRSRRTIHSDWEDEPVPALARDESVRSRPEAHRAFSFNPGTEATFNASARATSRTLPGIDSSLFTPPEDKTRVMAEEYISGLPTSPFAESPPALSPVSPAMDMNSDTQPADIDGNSDVRTSSLLQTPTKTLSVLSTQSPMQENPSSPVSMGSVRRYADKANATRSFIDETLAESPVTDRPLSPASFFSVPEPEDEADAPFASAVEIQPMTPRARSPRKPAAVSPVQEVRDSREAPRGPISDSGYSSNTSLGVIVNPKELRTPTGPSMSPEKDKKRMLRFPFQKLQKSGKPVLVKPTPSTKVPSPTSVPIESVSALTSQTSFVPTDSSFPNSTMSLPVSPPKTKEKRKKLVKLRRKSTAEVAGALVVQNLQSVDCLNIPPVSAESKNNLAQRARVIPELDRTYRTQDHTATSTNASVLSLATAVKDVRFPSPTPEEEEDRGRNGQARSRSRGRSFSRPRSWFDWPKRDRSSSRSNSKTRESPCAELNDFGSVAELLGSNPYDVASKARPTMPPSAWNNRPDFMRRRTSPSNITSNSPRQKSTMDDHTASTVSHLRRRSMTERDIQQENRKSFDERGAVPWRPSQDLHNVSDVPPLPPVPSPEEINRRFSYKNGYATHPRPFSYQNDSPTPTRNSQSYEEDQRWYQNDHQQYQNDQAAYEDNYPSEHISMNEVREAPPPPPHSPRPSYVEGETHDGYIEEPEHIAAQEEAPLPPRHSPRPSYVEDHTQYEHAMEDEAPAPPPPSHSPRPMDVTPEPRPQGMSRNTSWSSQANAWKARRQSAGEALRRSWGKVEQYYRPPQSANEEPSSPILPRDKPSSNRWTIQGNPQQPSYQEWRSSGIMTPDDECYEQPRQRPDSSQEAVRYLNDNYYLEEDQHYLQYEQFASDQYQNHPEMDNSRQGYDDYSCYQQQQQQQQHQQVHDEHWQQPHSQQPQQPYNFYHDYNRNQDPRQQHPIQTQPQQNHLRHPQAHPSSQRQATYPPVSTHNRDYYATPSPQPQPHPQPHARSRPTSRHSHHSHHSHTSHNSHRSLAEELHPELYSSPTDNQTNQRRPPPQSPQPGIGRYSGGLDFGYGGAVSPSFDGPGSGSPARNRDGADRRKRHSWLDMESYGIDLQDIPGVPVAVGAGERMVYR